MIEAANVTSLYVLLAFGLSYWILKKYLFVPLGSILDARDRGEREAQEAYAESLRRLDEAVAAGEESLAEARREALKSREELRALGFEVLEKKLAQARAAASDSVERGNQEIQEQVTRSSRDLPERSHSLARELAEKILGRKLAA
jgi:F-type H+-transporting ATPase subunit b